MFRTKYSGVGVARMLYVTLYMSRMQENRSFGFPTGPTETGLFCHRRWLEAENFGIRKKRGCTILKETSKPPVNKTHFFQYNSLFF